MKKNIPNKNKLLLHILSILCFFFLQQGVVNAEEPGADYLIITRDIFIGEDVYGEDPIADFKIHKENKKGLSVKVVTLSEITALADPQDQVQEIRDYLKNTRTWDHVPEYLLIVGDYELIPASKHNAGVEYGNISIVLEMHTDHYYANLDYSYFPDSELISEYVFNYPVGDFLTNDIFVGRLPVKNRQMLYIETNKIINYENNDSDEPWTKNILMTSMFDDTGRYGYASVEKIPGTELDGKEDSPFIETTEFIKTDIETYIGDMMIKRFYDYYGVYEDDDIPQSLYWLDETPLPVEIDELIRSGDKNSKRNGIVDALNEGVLLYTYRGHGSIGGEHFDIDYALNELTNINELPFVVYTGCSMGAFQYDCIGEQLLASENGGAVGFIGPTVKSNPGYNDELFKGIFDAIWPYDGSVGTKKLGKILAHAKSYMYHNYDFSDYSEMTYNLLFEELASVLIALNPLLWEYLDIIDGKDYMLFGHSEAYNLLGDPEMDLHINDSIRHFPPTAIAGKDQNIQGGVVTLNGSDSSDPDGVIVSHEWQLISRFFNNPAHNINISGETLTVKDLSKGIYDVTLTVTDNDGLSDTDTMVVTSCFISSVRW